MVRRISILAVAATLALALLPGIGTAATQPIGPACPDGQVPPADFWDVSGTHAAGIECLSWWGVTQGNTLTTYDARSEVTRGQMATFVARTIDAIGGQLPAPTASGFEDISGHTHQDSIERLAAAGVVSGVTATSFAPERAVPRGQMTTFLVRAFEFAAGAELPSGDNPFDDIAGHAHEANIVKAATAGFASGTSANIYDPDSTVTRAQMGSFLARLLAAGVDQLGADLPAAAPARIAGTGNDVVRGRISGDDAALVVLEHSGSSNFVVWTLDHANEQTSLLVNEIGDYSGMVAANFGSFTRPVRAFEVQADGAWSMRLLPMSEARTFGSSGGSGSGDEIVEASALAGSDLRLTHDGSRNFVVWAHDGDGNETSLVVNEIGQFDGVQVLPNDTRWLAIRADGNWTADPR